MIGGSELLGPAEIVLAPGASYTTPALFAAYSDRALTASLTRSMAGSVHGPITSCRPLPPVCRRVSPARWY